MRQIYVISGGTMVHVRPHFALCAPAYGSVGDELAAQLEALCQVRYGIRSVKTRMAGPSPAETSRQLRARGLPDNPETNDQLRLLLQGLLALPETCCIVMAAAICDYEPELLSIDAGPGVSQTSSFGKGQPRLRRASRLELTLRPADKLIGLVKHARPDVVLVSFKTTAGLTPEQTAEQAAENLARSSSDYVLGNDIHTQHNVVITARGERMAGVDRRQTITLLCARIMAQLEGDI